MEIAILALGCFWGPEEKFSKLNGVMNTEVGYCGGKTNPTTYEEVCSGSTNHAEVVRIEFDEKIITYENLLNKHNFKKLILLNSSTHNLENKLLIHFCNSKNINLRRGYSTTLYINVFP